MTKIDESKKYIQYPLDVISGKIVAGKYIKLACQRYIDWFKRDDVYFNYEDVDKKLNFAHKLRLREGMLFDPLPYQAWILSYIYGFY